MKKLFLDDVRTVDMVYENVDDFIVVRSYHEFVAYILENGLPDFISFDHDLGCNIHGDLLQDGYDAAKWLVYNSGLDLRQLEFNVHSANPVGADNIKYLLINYINHLTRKAEPN